MNPLPVTSLAPVPVSRSLPRSSFLLLAALLLGPWCGALGAATAPSTEAVRTTVGPPTLLGAPRVGRPPGNTRVVFDLPPGVTARVEVLSRTLTVHFHRGTAPGLSGSGVSPELHA